MDKTALAPALELNQLRLTESETEAVLSFFADMAKDEPALLIKELDEIEPMIHVVNLVNVLREDEASQPFTREELQKGAPEASDGCWQVPRLLE